MNQHKLKKLILWGCIPLCIIHINQNITIAAQTSITSALTIEATSSELNRTTGIATFVGNVAFDQGETHLRSSRLEVNFNNHNKITKAKATGQLAHYWTTGTAGKNVTAKGIRAQAETIIYYPLQHKVELIGHAKATQNQDTIEAPYIEYFSNTGYLASKATTKMRTRIILYPAQKTTAALPQSSNNATLKFATEKN